MQMESELGIDIDLYSACNLGDEGIVEGILKREATDVNAKNSGGWTPLMYASWGSHDKLVSLLLSYGARKEEVNNANQTPLIVAVKGGYLNIVKLVYQKDLLAHIDNNGKCALFYAVDFGYYDISSFLLSQGANADFRCKGTTVLMVAAMNGHHSLVRLLLEYGANVHNRDDQGFTAQQLAAMKQHLDIADILDPAYHAIPDLEVFLSSLGLHKYWPIFQENKIDFKKFCQMDEADLKVIGIKLLGPRRKMSLAISSLSKQINSDF